MFGDDGERLSKRHGSVTLVDIDEPAAAVAQRLIDSLDVTIEAAEPAVAAASLLAAAAEVFDLAQTPTEPLVFAAATQAAAWSLRAQR